MAAVEKSPELEHRGLSHSNGSPVITTFAATSGASGLASAAGAIKAWMDASPGVQAFSALATQYEALFTMVGAVAGVAGPIVTILYGLYSKYQQDKADKKLAKMIIKQIVDQVGSMIDRTREDIKNHIDEGRLKDQLNALAAHREKVQLWLETASDSDFAEMQPTLSALLITAGIDSIVALQNFLDEALQAGDAAKAALIYKNLIDVVQLHNHVLNVQDNDGPHSTNASAVRNINSLLEYHPKVLDAARNTLSRQFYGPVAEISFSHEDEHISFGGRARKIISYVYYFRGERVSLDGGRDSPVTLSRALKAMEAAKELDFLSHTENIRPLDAEHRTALAAIELLP